MQQVTCSAGDEGSGEIGVMLFGFMLREEVDVTMPLASVGVDSLVSIELRTRFSGKVGVLFTVAEMGGMTVYIAMLNCSK
ncbi:hypothetical protein AJ80_04396 [Polytolypa hystricis UAMH7299]|uniref:Carrier domain-containing protein n=1 Tax=Polytolypa hystricis (strain UAMH7299) TaxID=1447883 RepID=A0A2B7YC33_POLH7|nr:hypothetical protein AJ80_04396 [Polytolypa hystricis UAMH7299]